MSSSRTIAANAILVGFLIAPFFSYAQTATSTPLPNFMQQRAELQKKIDADVQNYINSIRESNNRSLKATANNVQIKSTPQDPGPSEPVTVTLIWPLGDLKKTTISWAVNGKTVTSGVGQNVFIFQNGQSGETTTVGVNVITIDGEQIRKDFFFTPLGATILWEADTYVPPFYKGKPLLSPEARVRVIAIPDNENPKISLTASTLMYTWKKNGMAQQDASGYSKNSFSFRAQIPFGKTGVQVSVSSLDGSVQSIRRIDLPLSNPFVLFYEKHPLLGVLYNRPLGTDFTLTSKEISLNATPYFFSNETSEVLATKYSWSVNGKTAQNYGPEITLRNDTGAKGSSLVSLSIRNLKQTFQSANKSLGIHFEESVNTSRPTF